ncbi:MAG: divergent polysaccharide deacetylase family protein [Paracoccaceae bacterium]
MARGFLSGAILGGVVSIAGASAISVVAGLPEQPNVNSDSPINADAPDVAEREAQASLGDADLVTEERATQVALPKEEDTAPASLAGQDTAPKPETVIAALVPDALTDVAQSSDVAPALDEPVLPSPLAAIPTVPGAEENLSISTDPAQPLTPKVDETEITATDAPAGLPELTTDESPVDTRAPQTDVATPEQPETPDLDVADQSDVKERSAEIAALIDINEQDRQLAGRPATSLIERESTTEPAETVATVEDADAETTDANTEAASDEPPLEYYATAFENPDDKPLMSIVLIDSGADISSGAIGIEALRSFPYPLNFAVDVTLPDANERMNAYRSEGFEVLALLDLPTGATATDAEINLSAAFDAVPEAVGLIEGLGAGLQHSREASDQVIAALKESGHGFVLQAKGLNTVQKLAAREGLPAALVFRDFDSAGQTPSAIRRFLDQAAFRADQEGGVIMMGRLRPDTVSALLLWGLQDRSRRVALAPVSATLKTKAGTSE